MQRLLYVLFQLDEALRYVEDGRLERLRLALLLLDNAAEIQMDRRIQEDLAHELWKERFRKLVLAVPNPARPASLEEILEWQPPLTTSQKAKIERLFDEKVKFLSERSRCLDSRLAEPLNYLHRYRNECYHRSLVRRETIRTATVILLEINCQLLLSIPRGVICYASDEDYSWMKERFGKDLHPMLTEKDIEELVDDIRAEILPSNESVAITLVENLQSRIEDLYAALDFIARSLVSTPSREEALKQSQYFAEAEAGTAEQSRRSLDDFTPRYTIKAVEELLKHVPEIRKAADRLDAFQRFSVLERELEPIEFPVDKMAADADQMIQLEIDRRRGK